MEKERETLVSVTLPGVASKGQGVGVQLLISALRKSVICSRTWRRES